MNDTPPQGPPCTFFVPGPWKDASSCAAALAGSGSWQIEWIPNDGHFAEAFAFGQFPKSRLSEISHCPGAVVVQGAVRLPAEVAMLSGLGAALAKAGAIGIRTEQSKAAFDLATWLELLRLRTSAALYRALTVVVTGGGVVSVSGMHVFGRPDATLPIDDPREGARILESLCTYQLDEAPVLISGHTFSPDARTPRRVLDRWPDHRFPANHACHNPFGIWRLVSPGEHAPRPSQEALVPVPALVAVLLNAERADGRPLTREQVEGIRDRAPSMRMPHADAHALEARRGYADVDPRRVWEQWQVARAALV